AHVQGVCRHALQSGRGSKRVPGVRTGLPARHGQKSESRFVQYVRGKDVGPAGHAVQGVGAQVAAESGQQTLLQNSRSEGIELARIEQGEADVGCVTRRKLVVYLRA